MVSNTLLYRYLAMTYVDKDDFAIEIGSAYGHCVAVFLCTALGVDIAPDKVEESREKYPHCKFLCGPQEWGYSSKHKITMFGSQGTQGTGAIRITKTDLSEDPRPHTVFFLGAREGRYPG